MKQEDIDRLLAGRKLIDDYLLVKEAIFADSETLKDEKDIAHADEMLKLRTELRQLGFGTEGKDVELITFYQFNTTMNVQAFKECRPVQGFCDLCKGNIDSKTGMETGPLCEPLRGCDAKPLENKTMPDELYAVIMARVRSDPGAWLQQQQGEKIKVGACPYPPHGFYVDEDLCTSLPFSIVWGIIVPEDKKAVITQLMTANVKGVTVKDAKVPK